MIIKSIWILAVVSYESGNKKLFSATLSIPLFLDPLFDKKLYTAISSSVQVVELSDNIYE